MVVKVKNMIKCINKRAWRTMYFYIICFKIIF